MKTDAITIDELSDGRVICELRSPKGRYISIDMRPNQAEPIIEGDAILTGNPAMKSSFLLALGAYLDSHDESLNEDEQKAQAKGAEALFKECSQLAKLSDRLTSDSRQAWCSSCLYFTVHQKVERRGPGTTIYLCGGCGSATITCTVPGCHALAVYKRKVRNVVPYCSEHRHELPSFENAAAPLADLADFREAMNYTRKNMARNTLYATAGIGAAGVATIAAAGAAPAIGGFIGVKFLGLTGAAATNAGLATLGGGALAAGGFGMAGGTAVITMTGTVIGGAWGTLYLRGYLDTDKSFKIKKIHQGTGPAVVIARGFFTENDTSWLNEERFAKLSYDNPTIYLLSWGAKELSDLGVFLSNGAAKGLAIAGAKKVVKRASKKAARNLGPAGGLLGALDVVNNPWHLAVNKAERAGQALAELIIKTDRKDWVLIGHSLGGRVMIKTATALSTKSDVPRILDVHLLGSAVSQRASKEWAGLGRSVSGTIHNYHSKNDSILAWLYRTAQGNKVSVGHSGFQTNIASIIDHDVSDLVNSHGAYYSQISQALRASSDDRR
ncbi:hypothetical protein CATRI_02770 [Corynebacterium atrinae]|uniref:DUF726 domain-containing protein n=1 Tax=Corynebacterium atrinae TaxID=1336740 RepID=UPI0025B4D4C6|nr:DUF726 domain-containing protein [Corynebacterium atrinae]WJY62659.1 hypothetical protein CATRI_02770 [Corynebacterium atrinae]